MSDGELTLIDTNGQPAGAVTLDGTEVVLPRRHGLDMDHGRAS